MERDFKLTGSLLAKNMMLNVISLGLPFVVMLITMPYLVRGLGPERYGIFALIWIVLGYLNLLNLGLGPATTKRVSEAIGKKDKNLISGIVGTSLIIVGALSITGACIFLSLLPFLMDLVFKVDIDLRLETKLAFYVATSGFVIAMLRGTLRGVLEAQQRFMLINLIKMPSTVLSSTLPVLVLFLGGTLPIVILSMVITDGLVMILYFYFCYFGTKTPLVFPAISKKAASSLISFGGWLTLQNVSSTILISLEPLLISMFLTLTALTYYMVPNDMVSKLSILPGSMVTVLFPAFSLMQGSHDSRLVEFFWASLKHLLFFMGLMTLILLIFAEEILSLWLGQDFLASANPLKILALGGFLGAVAWHLGAFLQGLNHIKKTSLATTALMGLNVALSWALIPIWGIEGAAISFAFTRGLGVVIFFVFCFRLRIILPVEIDILRVSKFILLIVAVILCVMILKRAITVNFLSITILSPVFLVAYLSAGWLISFNDTERKSALDFIGKVKIMFQNMM